MKQGTHFTASAYIVHDGKVLLHRHKKIGLLLPLGGYIEEGELPEEAVVREIKEESGLDIELIDTSQKARSIEGMDDGVWHQANPGMTMAHIKSRPGVVMLDITFAATCKDLANLGSGEVEKERFLLLSNSELQEHPDAAPNVKYYGKRALELALDSDTNE